MDHVTFSENATFFLTNTELNSLLVNDKLFKASIYKATDIIKYLSDGFHGLNIMQDFRMVSVLVFAIMPTFRESLQTTSTGLSSLCTTQSERDNY